jgi:hypothetical protein
VNFGYYVYYRVDVALEHLLQRNFIRITSFGSIFRPAVTLDRPNVLHGSPTHDARLLRATITQACVCGHFSDS